MESDINQKIDELTSAEEIAGSFLSQNFRESLKSLSYTAKEAFIHISELQNLENKFDGGELQLGEDIMDQFKDGKDKLMEKIESLKLEIGKSIATSTTQVSNKITNIFDPSKIEKGIKDLVPKN